jgi:hypothetical protein
MFALAGAANSPVRTDPAGAAASTTTRSARSAGSPEELLGRFHLEVAPSPSGVMHHLFWRRGHAAGAHVSDVTR